MDMLFAPAETLFTAIYENRYETDIPPDSSARPSKSADADIDPLR